MKLEVGMYVRYTRGMINGYAPLRIARITDCEDNELIKIDKGQVILRSDVIKASHSLIDLIDLGDYVNGYKVLEICTGNFELNNPLNVKALKLEFIKEDINSNIPFFKRYNFITNSEIKSIITKEQFESMKYEVYR